MEETPERDASMAVRVGRGLMVVAGLVLGLLIIGVGLAIGLYHLGLQLNAVAAVVVVGMIVAPPALLGFVLWGRSRRPSRHLAMGLFAGSGTAFVALLAIGVSTGFDPSAMSQGEIDDAIAKMTSNHREAFYLGDEADGKHLAEISHLEHGVLLFEYGRCMDNAEGGCTRPLYVTSQPRNTWGIGSGGDGPNLSCKRLRPVLGVPAAKVEGELMMFTGSSIVSVTYWEVVSNGYISDQPRQASLAPQLRPVGQPTAVKTLPPPDHDSQAFVDQHCGLEPGDTSRLP